MPVKMSGAPKGGTPKAPVAFGAYECGRSSLPQNALPTANFKFRGKKDAIVDETQGDPGAYDPTANDPLGGSSVNRAYKPFGSAVARELNMSIFGRDCPGPGAYTPQHHHRGQGSYHNIFKSGSHQRPTGRTRIPGPNHYSPNMKPVHGNMRDSGASMRGTGDRFYNPQDVPMTDEGVGPGAYEAEHGTLEVELKESMRKGSKTRPAFSTTAPARKLPIYGSETPGPGSYEPMQLRYKQLLKDRARARRKAEAADAVRVTDADTFGGQE